MGVGIFYGKCDVCSNVEELYEVLLPTEVREGKQLYRIEKLLCAECKYGCPREDSQ